MFEVHSNYGAVQFETREDAIGALVLLAPYHSLKIDEDKAREELERKAYFESFPLAVIKG